MSRAELRHWLLLGDAGNRSRIPALQRSRDRSGRGRSEAHDGVTHQHRWGNFSGRSGTLFLVVSLHAILFYGLVSTLSHIHGSVIPDPLQYQVLKDTRPHELPPPPPRPQITDVRIVGAGYPNSIFRESRIRAAS